MNGFVPALIAVLLAEIGWRADRLGRTRRRAVVATIVIVIVAGAATAGVLAAHSLTDWATALMVALALGFAAFGQRAGGRPAGGPIATLWRFWGGATPLIAFAFSARFGAVSVVVGVVAGLCGAILATRIMHANGVADRWVRWATALLLGLTGAVVGVNALRLAG